MGARVKIQTQLGTEARPKVCVEADKEKENRYSREPQPFYTFACMDAAFLSHFL